MGASLMEIKRRIASTKKTSQITSAMQMVSGAKLNQIEKRSQNYQLYASKIKQVVTHLGAAQLKILDKEKKDNESHEETGISRFLTERPVKKTGYLVITSDRGLVGSYNSTVIKSMVDMITAAHKKEDDYVFMAVGGNGADFFKTRGMNLAYENRRVSDIPTFNEVREILSTAVQMYNADVFQELYVCYNHHVNSLTSEFRAEKMLPISDLEAGQVDENEVIPEYLLEPSEEVILEAVLPQYAESLLFGAILDAKTAEHAASMTAMKSATDNAGDIIDGLTMTYNRARQAAITQEITEIVGGAAALE